MSCNNNTSLLEIMILSLGELAIDRQKFARLERIAHQNFVEKVNTILRYAPEISHFFVPEVHVGTETIDCEYEIIG